MFPASEFRLNASHLPQWRYTIFRRLFGFMAVFCIPVYVTSIYLCIAQGLWAMVIVDTLAYLLLLGLLFFPELSDRQRYLMGSGLCYGIGAAFMVSVGPTGAGWFWMFLFPLLTALLLGFSASIWAQVINALTLIAIGIAYQQQQLQWPPLPAYSTTIYFVVLINFMVLNAMLSLSIAFLMDKLSKSLEEAISSRQATVIGLAKLAEYRDNDTGEHLLRMAQYARLLATRLAGSHNPPDELTEEFIDYIGLASTLHDIGKVGIPDAILLKPGRLSDEEFETIKGHPQIGAGVLRDLQQYAPSCQLLLLGEQIASGHHEKWDGSGYPRQLEGKAIPLAARIVALADVYDALTSQRCYKRPYSHEEARQIIIEGRGKHFDPQLVDVFLSNEADFIAQAKQQDATEQQSMAS
ncbi:HD-GYP domain-containing protein [Shewanella cyperi]|uniref:HD domain-containing protein n=1 Tax=Shewanella cyperi TaxID=2814292 RepID=A0A975AJU4_9GAMM|nr:HD domain-containing phosphohydrolase [Shewanella cyperi]QSX29071.1 HD domain-containing protein [Shewanella cyperi]QSX39818.1 HD domain-containing protein [Shewanella cyperi]